MSNLWETKCDQQRTNKLMDLCKVISPEFQIFSKYSCSDSDTETFLKDAKQQTERKCVYWI